MDSFVFHISNGNFAKIILFSAIPMVAINLWVRIKTPNDERVSLIKNKLLAYAGVATLVGLVIIKIFSDTIINGVPIGKNWLLLSLIVFVFFNSLFGLIFSNPQSKLS